MARGSGCAVGQGSARTRGGDAGAPRRLYHGTSAADAAAIRAHGFRLDYPAGSDNKIWLTDTPDLAARYGEVVLEVDALIKTPLEVTYGEHSSYTSAAELAAAGYDATSVHYPQGHRLFAEPCTIITVSDPAKLTIVGERSSRYDAAAERWSAPPVDPIG